MREVAIVGAGELGGAVAHVLARRDAVRSIVLVDESGRVAAGKALDIAQAAPVEGFATQVTGTADLATVAGSSVVVVADRVAQGPWSTDEGLLLLKRLVQTAPRAVVICAGPSSPRARRARCPRASNRSSPTVRIRAGSAGRRRARARRAEREHVRREMSRCLFLVSRRHIR